MPRRLERVTRAVGWCSSISSAARSSWLASTGANEPATTMASSPASAKRLAASMTAASSSSSNGRPSYSIPPVTAIVSPAIVSARSVGQPTIGGRERPAGSPMRRKPTRFRSRRWTTALVNRVVPITTVPTSSVGSWARAAVMPPR